jgi:hypothetical protein
MDANCIPPDALVLLGSFNLLAPHLHFDLVFMTFVEESDSTYRTHE